jgi:rod shape-determining protein MreC
LTLHPATLPRFLTPLKAFAQRFAYSALVLLSVAIIVIGKADVTLVERLRTGTGDLMAPVLSVLSRPVAAGEALVDRIGDMAGLYDENARLKEENATLLQWQQAARHLEIENQALRGLTNYQPGGATWYITGRVVGTAGGAYSRSLLIDRGGLDGIAKGQAATSGIGLVGRIAEVGDRSARVLLVTDLNSRIPVTLQNSHERAILAGDNSARPLLTYLAPNAKPEPGEPVVTSGEGGIFPPGIPVGTLVAAGGQMRVVPSSDLSTIEYVRIVDFGLSGMLPPSAVPAAKPPKKGAAESGAHP